MIDYIKDWLFVFRHYRKQKKIASNLDKAQEYAILALAYWNECERDVDIGYHVEGTGIYVRLGER